MIPPPRRTPAMTRPDAHSEWLFPGAAPAASEPALASAQRVYFDIEISNVIELAPGQDLEDHGPFDIAVAAACDEHRRVHHWLARDERGTPLSHIDATLAREVLLTLRDAQRRGARVFAWNGMSFDVRWLGVAAGDLALAREVALELYDPMLQFVGRRGFPVGLAAVAEGLGIADKKLMAGADAPKEWQNGNYQRVLDYVAGDCRLTAQVVERIESTRSICWRTKKGSLSSEPMPELRRVREVMRDPAPDQSWMSTPKPWKRWFAWLEPHASGA